MSWVKDFVWPWQKHWPKAPEGAEVFKHFDHNINLSLVSFSIFGLTFTILNIIFGSWESTPNHIIQPVTYFFVGVLILGVAADIFRPRYWKLSAWEDGAIYQTLFQCITLTKEELANLAESSRLGLSLRVNAGGKTKYASLVAMPGVTPLREQLSQYLPGIPYQEASVFKSPFNLSINYIGVPVSSGIFLMYLTSKQSALNLLSDFKVFAFYTGLLFFLGLLPSLSKNLGFKVTVTQDELRFSHILTKRLKWKDVDKVILQKKRDSAYGRLMIETPDKMITIPETVVNYWQLVQQVKARIPATAKFIEQ